MRNAVAVIGVALLLVAAYALSPLWVAMDVKRAVLAGDVATLETRVDWPNVRQSLKESLAAIERQKQEEATVRGVPQPSLWSRIKAAASPARYADQLIDRYVTADGVVRMAAARGSMTSLLGKSTDQTSDDFTIPDHAQPLVERAQRFWNRLKRVSILSATALEIEIADRRVAARSYIGVVKFAEMRWRLTDVRVVGTGF